MINKSVVQILCFLLRDMEFVHFIVLESAVTPTVELNALAMKLGQHPDYINTEQPSRPPVYRHMTPYHQHFPGLFRPPPAISEYHHPHHRPYAPAYGPYHQPQ